MAAIDVLTRAYPLLPTPRRGAPRQRIVVPQQGDLHKRTLAPRDFLPQLVLHCPPESRQLYGHFKLERRFMAMSCGGDLYTHHADMELRIGDLPPMLPMPPPLAPWDVVKVLDLVQCYQFSPDGVTLVPRVRWELVRVRWRNSRETWIPIELMISQAASLLQDFYVNSINSWGFHDRLFPESLTQFKTEVQLWLQHPDFQALFHQLHRRAARRLRRATRTSGQANSTGTLPAFGITAVARAPAASDSALAQALAPAPTTVDVKDRRLTAEAARVYTPPQPELPQQRLPLPPQPQPVHLQPHLQQLQQQRPLQQSQPPPSLPAPSREASAYSDERRIPHQLVVQLPPLPPTPPRPSQERPPELRVHLAPPPPPPFTLAGQREPLRETPVRHSQASAKSQRRHKSKPKTCSSSSSRDKDAHGKSTPSKSNDRDKEREKRDKERRKLNHSRRETRSPAKEKERSSKRARSSPSREKERKKRRERSPETPRTKKRRKRLKWSQAPSESDESDDLLQLTPGVATEEPETERQKAKLFRRLRRAQEKAAADAKEKENPIIVIDDDDEDDGEDTRSKPQKRKNPEKQAKTKKKKKKSRESEKGNSNGTHETTATAQSDEFAVEIDVADFSEVDDEAEDDSGAAQQMLLGEIRCECGVARVGRYTGQWVQCCKDDCEVWQHAECVGLLVRRGDRERLPDKYRCSKCDPDAFKKRYEKSKLNPRAWLSLCCETRNQDQVLKLLEEEDEKDSETACELASSVFGSNRLTLLMEASHSGLPHAVRRLIRRFRVNVHTTDARSHNALYYAVKGESVSVAMLLIKHAEGLVRHQDLTGQMPLHLMLRSPALNGLCMPLLIKHPSLCVTSDFAGVMPIHFACQAVNKYTIDIVRQILSVRPTAALDKSPEGLTPFIYLCRASRAATSADIVLKASCVDQIVDLFLDVDALALFLNDRDPHGWAGLHFAAEAGNHALLLSLCLLEGVEVDAITFDGGETALHLAARANQADCVRVLLENPRRRLNVAAVDGSQWIPALRSTDASCLQRMLCYSPDKQLLRISNHASNFRHHETLRRWMWLVTSDPTCHAIVNDWLQYHIPLLDELDELLTLHRSFFRVDCKLDYAYQHVFPAIKRQSRRRVRASTAELDQPSVEEEPLVEITLSSASGECYWNQFVAQTRDFDAIVFRQKLRLTIARGGNLRRDNLMLVLVRFATALLQPAKGLLTRDDVDATLKPSPHRQGGDAETLREYFVLGELIAYLVLNEVSVGDVFEFSTAFLQCVVGLRPDSASDSDSSDEQSFTLRVFAESFAAGFDAVLPATLALFHAEELRMLLNARVYSLNVSAMDWETAVEWVGFASTAGEDSVVKWWVRMVNDLVEDERVALVLWLTGSFRHAQRVFFLTGEAVDSARPTVRIQRYKAAEVSEASGDGTAMNVEQPNNDTLLPVLDVAAHTLVLPLYSTFERFRTAVLGVFRHADYAARTR